MTLAAEDGVISGVAFSGDGTQVMTGSENERRQDLGRRTVGRCRVGERRPTTAT